MVGAIAKAVPGDGVKVHAIVGNQQVKAPLALLGIVVDAKIEDEVMNGGIIKHLVASVKQLLQLLPEHSL